MKKLTVSSRSLKLHELLDYHIKQFANLAISRKYSALKHHKADTVGLINKTWRDFAVLLFLAYKLKRVRNAILSTLESLPKINWMTFLDKLNISNNEPNMLPILLFQTLLQELISKERDFKPFWTPVYKELSEKLLLPIEIDSHDSVLTSSKSLPKKPEEASQFLTMNKINLQNKPKTYYQLSTSTVVGKWEKEATAKQKETSNLKALKIKMKPNQQQRSVIDEWINTSRYVYNKTVNLIAEGHKINHFELRDIIVTENTKKTNPEYQTFIKELAVLQQKKKESHTKEIDNLILQKKLSRQSIVKDLKTEKNANINEWELNTPKAVRDAAVSDVCKAYKTGFSNLKAGNIRHFQLQFKKKTNPNKCVCVPKSLVKNVGGVIKLSSSFFKDNCNFKMGKKTIKKHKNLVIRNDIRIVKQKGIYWFVIPIPVTVNDAKPLVNYCGIDPGVRSFMTSFGNHDCIEYKHDESQLRKYNDRLAELKSLRCNKLITKRILKKKYNRLESKKEHLINELHWKVINDLLTKNDVIFYGDIKSHDIVKNGKNKILNTNMNDLKFYTFKSRLLSKALEKHKRVVPVNEAYTTQTCCCCGMMYKPGISKVYNCQGCNSCVDRDVNASKNILMKGIVTSL